jgi:hypothetical protein
MKRSSLMTNKNIQSVFHFKWLSICSSAIKQLNKDFRSILYHWINFVGMVVCCCSKLVNFNKLLVNKRHFGGNFITTSDWFKKQDNKMQNVEKLSSTERNRQTLCSAVNILNIHENVLQCHLVEFLRYLIHKSLVICSHFHRNNLN